MAMLMTINALGPDVVKNIEINRHYAKEAGIQVAVAGLAPGVMAQTGMETAELVRGVVRQLKPDVLIAIGRRRGRKNRQIRQSSYPVREFIRGPVSAITVLALLKMLSACRCLQSECRPWWTPRQLSMIRWKIF